MDDPPRNSTSDFDECRCNDMSEKDYSQAYAVYNAVVALGFLPTVALFGLFSNMANIFIFTRPSFVCSPSNLFLLSLSCSDFMTVLTGVFLFCSDSARVYLPWLTPFATEGVIWILPLGYIAQTCSVYFTMAAAVECYVKVCLQKPMASDGGAPTLNCTPSGAKAASLFVALFSVGYNFPRFWQFELHKCYDDGMNGTHTELCPTLLYHDIEVVYNVYMYMILMTALPFITLSVLNVLIVRKVRRSKRRKFSFLPPPGGPVAIDQFTTGGGDSRARLVRASSHTPSRHGSMIVGGRGSVGGCGDGGDDGVITMIMVVIMFLACNTLALVVNIVETFFEPDVLVVQFMTDTSNLLVVFNSSVNFVIYLLFDKAYAAEFRRLFCTKRRLSSATSRNSTTSSCLDENMNADILASNYVFTKNRYDSPFEHQQLQPTMSDVIVPPHLRSPRFSLVVSKMNSTRRSKIRRGSQCTTPRGKRVSLPAWHYRYRDSRRGTFDKYSNGDLMKDVTMEKLMNGIVEKVDV